MVDGEEDADLLRQLDGGPHRPCPQPVGRDGLPLDGEGPLDGAVDPVGDDVPANFLELRSLEKSIGRRGLLALKPVLRESARDVWQMYFLEEAGGAGESPPPLVAEALSRP